MKTITIIFAITIAVLSATIVGMYRGAKNHNCWTSITKNTRLHKPYPPASLAATTSDTNRISMSNAYPACVHTGLLDDIKNHPAIDVNIHHWSDGTTLTVCRICADVMAVQYRSENSITHLPVAGGEDRNPFVTKDKKADRDAVYKTYRERMDAAYTEQKEAISNLVWRAKTSTNAIIVQSNTIVGNEAWSLVATLNDTNRFLLITDCLIRGE
jgi:hypothetical protein